MDRMTDGEMIVMLHDLARATKEDMLRDIADRFSELVKEAKHKEFEKLHNPRFYH